MLWYRYFLIWLLSKYFRSGSSENHHFSFNDVIYVVVTQSCPPLRKSKNHRTMHNTTNHALCVVWYVLSHSNYIFTRYFGYFPVLADQNWFAFLLSFLFPSVEGDYSSNIILVLILSLFPASNQIRLEHSIF